VRGGSRSPVTEKGGSAVRSSKPRTPDTAIPSGRNCVLSERARVMFACMLLFGAFSRFAFCQSPAGDVSDALRIDSAFFRRPATGGAGTAYLFLKNVGKRSLLMTELEVDGYRVPISNGPEEVQAEYQKAKEAAQEKAQQGPLKIDKLAVAAQRILW